MQKLKVKNYVKIIAGSFVFIFTLLGYFYNQNYLFLVMFVGLNLFQSGFTNWCLLNIFLKKLGIEE